jgi:hypothetical protein
MIAKVNHQLNVDIRSTEFGEYLERLILNLTGFQLEIFCMECQPVEKKHKRMYFAVQWLLIKVVD